MTQPPNLWPCPNCQTPIPGDSTFCPKCGHQLTQAQAPPKKGMSRAKKAAIAIGVLVLLLVAISAFRGGAPAPTGQRTPDAPGAPQQPAGPQTLLSDRGSGIKKTGTFTTTGQWTLAYTFDCSDSFTGQGNFQVFLYSPPERPRGVSVNELSEQGRGSTPEYATGEFYLSVNSGCEWTVTVTQP